MSLFDTGVRPIIDNYLLDLSKERRSYGEYWSASSAGYCMRKVIFDRLGVPKTKDDPRKQRVFTSGHIFHDWIQGITKAAGLSIAQELELQDEDLMIRGHFDDLVLVDGKPILYDYKTRNSKNFEPYAKRPSYYHKMQLGTYLYMLKKAGGLSWFKELPKEKFALVKRIETSDLVEARTLNISKDDLRMCEVQYLWSDDLAKEVIDYWLTLNRFWLDKKMPPCTCADRENGFLAKEAYNDYYFNGKPCSLEWLKQWGKSNAATAPHAA